MVWHEALRKAQAVRFKYGAVERSRAYAFQKVF